MSKMNLGLTVLTLSGLALVAGLSPNAAHAQNDDGPAVVYHACPTEYGELTIGAYDVEYCFDSTATPSGNGNATFHGYLIDKSTAPKKTDTVSGFACYAGNGITYDTELTVTPSGRILGVCKAH